jgi:hypothetical protein
MGCDVHSFVERWDGARWEWLRGDLFTDWRNLPTFEPFERSYPLFGLLAGVRDRDVPMIHETRGLPGDMDPDLRKWFGFTLSQDCLHGAEPCLCVYEDSGLFGHSWATGAELLAYDFSRTLPCPACHDKGCGQHPYHWCESAEDHDVTLADYVGEGWVEVFGQIAALSADPAHVRVVYAFNN